MPVGSAARWTFILEELGKVCPSEVIVPALLHALEHESPLVREGALMGLYEHRTYPGVLDRARDVVASDPSPGVRMAASDLLDED